MIMKACRNVSVYSFIFRSDACPASAGGARQERIIPLFVKSLAWIGSSLLFLLISFTVSGQQGNIWSLQDCIDHAMENNLDIRLQRMEESRAGHDLTRSYANTLPSFNASSNASFNFGRSIDEVTNEFFTERVASQGMAATTSLNLFAGFRTINNIRYHMARQTALRHDTENLKNTITLTIANAYLQILYFEDMKDVTREQVELAGEQAEKTRILFDGGTVSRGDLLEMKAMVAEEEARLTGIQNNLEMSYLELKYLLELDPGKDFRIERPDISAEEQQMMMEPERVVDRALLIEPSVNSARQRIQMAEKSLDIRKGERYPTLSLHGALGSRYSDALKRMPNGNTNSIPLKNHTSQADITMMGGNGPLPETVPYVDQLRENYYRTVQLSLSIPIFNGLQTRNRIQHARIDLDRSRIQYEQSKNQLTQIIYEAYSDALGAWKNYESNTRVLEAARESYQYAEESFNLGVSSTLEYNEAKARLNRAEVNALQAMYEFVFMVKILEFYQGEGFVIG